MAEVFAAQDDVLDRPVAVKVFRAEHVANGDAHGIERQHLEVAALARLNHPNLIALYDGSIGDASADGGHAYIVMELIDGPPLSERIAAGPLPEASVREIGIQLADGLAYVHSQGMVHRDVKPENILLGVDKSDDDSTVRARLSDFGIVRLLGSERLTNVNFTLGTASYLAPEQARGSDVEPPADVYALALVLLEALTGQRAFTGAPLEAAMARLSQRPMIPADLPEPWPQLLYAMTEYDPALRPSAPEVARILRNEGSRSLPLVPLAVPVAAGLADAPTGMVPAVSPPAGPPSGRIAAPPAEPARRKHRPSGVLVAAVVSVLVIAATLTAFLLTGSDSPSPAAPPGQGGSNSARNQAPSDHPESRSHSGGNQPGVVGGQSRTGANRPSKSAPSSAAPSASHSSAPATHSSAPHTSSAPSTSAPRTSAPPSTSAAPSTSARPSSSAASTAASSPAATTSAASTSPSPNSRTTTPAG
jgi:serine/threonine protein kinase